MQNAHGRYDRGARIFLNGWNLNFATANREYTVLDQSVDNFAYNNPEALVIFPAGNHGACGPDPL
jgi:hypothetical protein